MNYRESKALEDLLFKYERMQAILDIIHSFLAINGEASSVPELQENSLTYALYEVLEQIRENNRRLDEIILGALSDNDSDVSKTA